MTEAFAWCRLRTAFGNSGTAASTASFPFDGPSLALDLQAGAHCATGETVLLTCGHLGGSLNRLAFCADDRGRR